MKTPSPRAVAAGLLLLLAGTERGAASGAFLRLGAGSRAAALGQAQTALVQDATALYWNTAALAELPGANAVFSHGVFFNNESSYDYAAYGRGRPGKTAWGASLQYHGVGSLPRLDSNGQEIGSFTPNDLAVTAGAARKWRGSSFGIHGKFVQSKILHTARTAALGAGYLSPWLWEDTLRLGVTADNWGGALKFNQESDPLPSLVRAGALYRIDKEWDVVTDGEWARNSDPVWGGGVEYHRNFEAWTGFLRLGYTNRGGSRTGFSGVTVGGGAILRRWSLDYALLPDGDIGHTHLFTLGWSFR